MDADFIVVGGGIVGLSTAMHLLEDKPGMSVLVIDKESGIAAHQTSHNSGVIHSGIYYRPKTLKAKYLIACAGLLADRVARMCSLDFDFRIIPFRGEFYRLPEAKSNLVKQLIYPIPDPALPFLGVHLTPMIDGRLIVGPNAALALKREGYRKHAFNLNTARTIHVCNAPSPAATSALPIGRYVVSKVNTVFDLDARPARAAG